MKNRILSPWSLLLLLLALVGLGTLVVKHQPARAEGK